MRGTGAGSGMSGEPFRRGARSAPGAIWAFVYVFFSNGTPFDAPNRSETCPRR